MEPFDLVIVGGGVAGLAAALNAPEGARIAVVDKGEDHSGSSPLAQGGLAAAVGPDDSPDLHATDTIAAGAGLCDERVVADVCAEGPDAVAWLVKVGCAFDRDDRGDLHLAREGGQSVARSVHRRDDTGAEIVRALRAAARGRAERIRAKALALIVGPDGRCAGVHTSNGPVLGRATLLASGGAGALWSATTNAPGATGDGIVLAMAARVAVADLEFMQFHPTALRSPRGQRVLLTEALRGDGATLIDAAGERFVDELAPRHVVAKAILDAGEAWLDCRGITDLERRFPTVVEGARRHGFDPIEQPLPVEPAAHYFIGGVAADAHGRTGMPGLFAAGECASSGMHGANRMAGNSLLEAVVVGRRVGAAVAAEPVPAPMAGEHARPAVVLGDPPETLPAIMWRTCGPIRDAASLQAGLDEIGELLSIPHAALAHSIVSSALARDETRGVHVRADRPDADPQRARRYFSVRNIRPTQ